MYKHYTTPDTEFVLNLDFTIPNTHIARFISGFVDSIPDAELVYKQSKTGRPAHHPRLLLKMLLYAYSRGVYSGRKIVEMNEENIPMKWLTRETYVCYRSINDFRVNPETSLLIQKAFLLFNFSLKSHDMIKEEALFIDGTKIEADANKYSFVWRKSIEKYDHLLTEKVKDLYQELIEQKVNIAIEADQMDTSDAIESMIGAVVETLEQVEQTIDQEPKVIPGGSQNKRQRRLLKKYLRQLQVDFLPRKKRYEHAMTQFNGRNSFSKTDHDATFMCMKEDPMKNRELKPGYNVQVATNQQFCLAYDIFSNPTDTRTLLPFLKSIDGLEHIKYIVADAGYGSEENYAYIFDELEKEALIPYTMYNKEKTRKYQQDPTLRHHWTYIEDIDCYVDHQGVQFSFHQYKTRVDKHGYERTFKVYLADKTQSNRELDRFALTPKGRQRRMEVNLTWDHYKAKVRENLDSESGRTIYAQRKIEVETFFGRMKRNFGVRRVHVRGELGVRNDLGLLFMSMNLSKLLGILISDKQGKGLQFIYLIYFVIKKVQSEEKSVTKPTLSSLFELVFAQPHFHSNERSRLLIAFAHDDKRCYSGTVISVTPPI